MDKLRDVNAFQMKSDQVLERKCLQLCKRIQNKQKKPTKNIALKVVIINKNH